MARTNTPFCEAQTLVEVVCHAGPARLSPSALRPTVGRSGEPPTLTLLPALQMTLTCFR